MNAWFARNLLYRPAAWLRGEPVFDLLREYEESQWWAPGRMQAAQERDLTRMLRHATAATPYYGDLARAASNYVNGQLSMSRQRAGQHQYRKDPYFFQFQTVHHTYSLGRNFRAISLKYL